MLRTHLFQSLRTKMGRDLSWNFLTFIILGISGILLNLVIAKFRGPEALGIFNQAYSFYIVASQFSVFGVYLSTLKYTVEYRDQPENLGGMMTGGLVVCGGISLMFAFFFYGLGPLIGGWLSSPQVGKAIQYLAPGMLFFSMNKVLLSFLNGLRRMRAFAHFQSLRYLSILFVLCMIVFLGGDAAKLSIAISAAEIFLFFVLLAYCKRLFTFHLKKIKTWCVSHMSYGSKGLMGGAISELNTRVDILMLGYFTTDFHVGIYSLPAMLVEGVAQLSVLVRDNVNPLLTKHYLENDRAGLYALIRQIKLKFFAFMAITGGISLLFYPLFLKIFKSGSFDESWIIFFLLTAGLILSSAYMPLNGIFNQTGFPGWQTILVVLGFLLNILLNLLLIPLLGIAGAALATGLSWALSVVLLKFLSRKVLSVKI